MSLAILTAPRWTLARCMKVGAVVYVGEFLSEAQRVMSAAQPTDSSEYPLPLRLGFGSNVLLSLLVAGALLYLVGRLRMPRVPWVAVAVTVSVVGAILTSAAAVYLNPYTFGITSSSHHALFLYSVWVDALCVLLMFGILDRLRATDEADHRVRALQDEERAARQRVAQSRLQAIQARIDPQLLFDMLAAVQRLYVENAARAELLLDELTVFLRAALPLLRSARSSLAEEFELATSYERMQQLALGVPAGMRVDLPPALQKNAFPPGVMLPLAASVLAAQSGAASVALFAEQLRQHTRVRIDSPRLPDEATMNRVRSALADLYGPLATLRTERQRDRFRIEVEVPLEFAT